MYIKNIRQSRSLIDVFVVSIYILILFTIASLIVYGANYAEGNTTNILFAGAALFFFIVGAYNWQIERKVKSWRKQIAQSALQHELKNNGELTHFNFSLSSLDNKEGIRNASFKNKIQDKDWAYADFSYDIMKETKLGEYRAITVYYSVMTTKLPRRLPHVFFDSRQSRGRQFRPQFSSAQVQSLEGDFDKHFVTYFPEAYHIDGRSFISPEVMWAIREASDYDVEIINDQVFIFGDFRDPETQIPEMVTKITNIKDKLLNNVVTYRDESLPYATARLGVSELGARLAQNLTNAYAELIFGTILLLACIAGVIYWKGLNSAVVYSLIFGFSLTFDSGRKIYQEKKRRKLALESYLANKEQHSKTIK